MAEKTTFPRPTSGLRRELGPTTAMFVTIAFAVGWGWQSDIFRDVGRAPLPENLWFAGIPPGVAAYILAGIVLLIMMLGYSILLTALPRTGGGYVAISRIVSPFAAFVGSWFEFCFVGVFLGVSAVVPFELIYGPVGAALGLAPAFYSDIGFLVGGLFLLAVFTVISLLGLRVTSYALQLLVWIPLALGLYILFLMGAAVVNPEPLRNGITIVAQGHGMTGVTANAYVKGALAQGLDSASVGDYMSAVSASILGAYLSYTGYAAITFIVGEVREPEKNLPRTILLAPLIVILMFVTMAAFAAYAGASVGQTTLANGDKWTFYEAYSYLSYGGGSLQQAGLPASRAVIPTLASMVGAGLGLSYLNIIIAAFSILWLVNEAPAFLLVASRIIFAMSFDRVLPASLSKVSGRFNVPIYAIISAAIFGILGTISETCIVCNGGSWYLGAGPLGDLLNYLFVDGLYFVYIMDAAFFTLFSLAVVLFPFRLKEGFERARFKPGGKSGVIAIGIAGLIGNLIIAWAILTSPQGGYNILAPSADNLFTLGFTVVFGIIGALIYAYYRFGPSRKVVDYSAIFSKIPPE